MVLVLGDAHADDPDNREALLRAYRESGADVALQTGDLLYYDLPVQTWFVAGNDEDHDVIEALREGRSPPGVNGVSLLAGETADIAGVRVAGLSGTYAPTQYEKSRAELSGERRRHFVEADVERVASLSNVAVLLTHEAPHGVLTIEDHDVGCRPIDDLLGDLEPELCLVGHHHRHAEGTFGGTRVVTLAPVWECYYELDPGTLSLERRFE